MEGDSYIFNSNSYEKDVLIKFKQMRDKGLLTDLVVCVDQEELLCHKLVLAASSTYFSKMFSLDLRENLESRVTFNQVSPWVMKRIIEYAYTGSIEITVQNVQDVLAACCLFEYPAIVGACCNFLKLKLDASNCLGIEQFAHMHLCFQLEKDAHKFALENFGAVIENSEFVQISADMLLTYISDDNIDVVNESTVFSACLKWIHYDYERRKSVFCKIMLNVRFSTLDKTFIESVVKGESHISQCKECSSLVFESSSLRVSKEQDTDKEAKACRRRPSTVAKETIFIIGGFDEERCVQRSVCGLNCQKKVYFNSLDMPVLVCYFSACVLNNNIYITGGIASGNIVASVWRFVVETKQWQLVNSMMAVRARHASIAWKNKMYVIGGITADETNHNNVIASKNIECFDPLFQTWTVFGYTPNPRKHSCLVAIDDVLLEVGGVQGPTAVDRTDSYILTENALVCSGEQFLLPEVIHHCQVLVSEGLLYIIWDDKRKMVSLDPKRRVYRELAAPRHDHVQGSATVINGQIWLVGGGSGQLPSTSVEFYNPTTDQWTDSVSLPAARSAHACVTVVMN